MAYTYKKISKPKTIVKCPNCLKAVYYSEEIEDVHCGNCLSTFKHKDAMVKGLTTDKIWR